MRDPYEVLGVQRGASAAAIKSAYRKLAKKHHPDSQQGRSESRRPVFRVELRQRDPRRRGQAQAVRSRRDRRRRQAALPGLSGGGGPRGAPGGGFETRTFRGPAAVRGSAAAAVSRISSTACSAARRAACAAAGAAPAASNSIPAASARRTRPQRRHDGVAGRGRATAPRSACGCRPARN